MKRSFTPTQDLELAAQYTGRGCIGKLAALHGVTMTTIRMALLRAGVIICQEKLSADQKAVAVSRYLAGDSSHEIAADLHVTHPTITKALREADVVLRNVSQAARLHSIDETAFDVVTPESAYWIGFIMADGSVSKSGNLSVCQTQKDAHHLDSLRLFLKSSHPISTRQGVPIRYKEGTAYIPKPVCILSICCKPIAEVLRRYGLHADKSNGASVVGLQFNRDFWRGVVDGDGSVRINIRRKGHPYACVSLVGSRPLLKQFAAFVHSHIPNARATIVNAGGRLCQVAVNSAYAIQLSRILYEGAAVALPRKAQSAERIMHMLD